MCKIISRRAYHLVVKAEGRVHGWLEGSAVLPEDFVHDLHVPTLTPLMVQQVIERGTLSLKRAHFIFHQVPYLQVMSVQRHWCRGSLLTVLVLTHFYSN